MSGFIDPPPKIPLLLRPFVWLAEKIAGKILAPARLLTWSTRVAVGSGVLEALVAHGGDERDGRNVSARLLKLVRIRTSFAIACPYCIDMNSFEPERADVTHEEVVALQAGDSAGFAERERAAMDYAVHISSTPLHFPPELIDRVRAYFSPRQIVILASTAAQVNYWGRLIQALGLPPAGFGDLCTLGQVESVSPDL
jgi:alkylhydroperoxidase family enzyme